MKLRNYKIMRMLSARLRAQQKVWEYEERLGKEGMLNPPDMKYRRDKDKNPENWAARRIGKMM